MTCGISRVFLDTCIVRYAVTFSEYIWDNDDGSLAVPAFLKAGAQQQCDYLALAGIFQMAKETDMELVVSPTTLRELPASARWYGVDLFSWWERLKDQYDDEEPGPADHGFAAALELRLLDFLPDPIDRRLIAESVLERCDAFLTTDRRTIWQHRDRLKRLGIRALRPSEMWTLIC